MKRQLKSAFPMIPAGEQVVRIKEVQDKDYEKFQKLTVVVEDVNGATANINFNFVKDDGSTNDVAEGIYTRMCRAALNDQTLDECDWEDLPGCYVLVEIEHNEGAKGGTFANVKKWIGPATKFDKPAKAPSASAAKNTPAASAEPPKKKTAAEILAEARAKAAKK
jgi:hypothetical protein